MKLSEAIRLGAMLKPQGFDHYEEDGHTCAVGAARDAGGDKAHAQWIQLEAQLKGRCPLCGPVYTEDELFGTYTPVSVVPHLNDFHRWSREQIADWVQTIEDAHVPAQEPATARTTDAVDPVEAA